MNQHEQEQFESELRQVGPARVPQDFLARLSALKCSGVSERRHPSTSDRRRSNETPQFAGWLKLLGWLTPAMALVVAAFVSWHHQHAPGMAAQTAATAPLKPDDVQINRELVSTFDAVAQLPNGQPVRFRCREWLDRMVVSDNSRGLVVEHQSPRLEVVPVRFETY